MLARLRPHRRIILAVAAIVNAILAIALANSPSAAQPTSFACSISQNCFCLARNECVVGGSEHLCSVGAQCPN